MQRIAALDGDHDGPFERIVFELVMGGAMAVEITPDIFRGRLADGRHVGVARFGPDVVARLRAARAGMWRGGGVLVLAGGTAEARPDLFAATPSFVIGSSVDTVHLDDDGVVTGEGLSIRGNAPPNWDAFWARATASNQRSPAAVTSSSSAGSWLIGALIVVMFAVELAYRCTDLPPALNRLGALLPSHVRDGEVWRLGSSMFLHAGLLHIGVNLAAFASLGPSTERLIGSWRFLLLYALAGIGGGLAATFLQDAPAVGASGALWGVMTAQFVLVWRIQDRLPAEQWKKMRNSAVRALGINLVITALPGIAWSAHLGGGLVGALMALAFGRLDKLKPVGRPLVAGAIAASAFVAGGAIYGALGMDMSILSRPPVYARVNLDWGTAELPQGIHANAIFGDILMDPGMIVLDPGFGLHDDWDGYTDDGPSTVGGVSLHRYHASLAHAVVARRADDAKSPTVTVIWWNEGPWDVSVATRVLQSIEVRTHD